MDDPGEAAWQGAYPLPDEEDVEAIRAEIVEEHLKKGLPLRKLGHPIFDRGLLHRATKQGWGTVRKIVWRRDEGICHICGWKMPFDYYECGHIIDWSAGGCDRPSNAVVMCYRCNHYVKGQHRTRKEYLDWLAVAPEVRWARALARGLPERTEEVDPPDPPKRRFSALPGATGPSEILGKKQGRA